MMWVKGEISIAHRKYTGPFPGILRLSFTVTSHHDHDLIRTWYSETQNPQERGSGSSIVFSCTRIFIFGSRLF